MDFRKLRLVGAATATVIIVACSTTEETQTVAVDGKDYIVIRRVSKQSAINTEYYWVIHNGIRYTCESRAHCIARVRNLERAMGRGGPPSEPPPPSRMPVPETPPPTTEKPTEKPDVQFGD